MAKSKVGRPFRIPQDLINKLHEHYVDHPEISVKRLAEIYDISISQINWFRRKHGWKRLKNFRLITNHQTSSKKVNYKSKPNPVIASSTIHQQVCNDLLLFAKEILDKVRSSPRTKTSAKDEGVWLGIIGRFYKDIQTSSSSKIDIEQEVRASGGWK